MGTSLGYEETLDAGTSPRTFKFNGDAHLDYTQYFPEPIYESTTFLDDAIMFPI
jgi:hypothetical protein